MYLNKKTFNMNLIRKKIFILFCCGIFFTRLSINSSMENNFFPVQQSLKEKKTSIYTTLTKIKQR